MAVHGSTWNVGESVFGGQYVVEAFLGNGARGAVYRLKDLSIGYSYAVKRTIFPLQHSGRFIEELETWTNIPRHPNLTRCFFPRSCDDGTIAIFSEYVGADGLTSLTQHLARHHFQSSDEIVRCAIGIGEGLFAIHRLGWVHADFKPHNVLIGADWTPKIADFGQAIPKSVPTDGDALKVERKGAATGRYKSFEQASRLGPTTQATDIWAFGLCVLEMYMGECTWDSGLVAPRILAAALEGRLVRPPRVNIPSDVAALMKRCLSTSDAWTSMGEVVNRLRTIAEANGCSVGESTRFEFAQGDKSLSGAFRHGSLELDSPEKSLNEIFKRFEISYVGPVGLTIPLTEKKAAIINAIRRFEEAIKYASSLTDSLSDLARRLLVQTLTLHKARWFEISNDIPGAYTLYEEVINSTPSTPDEDKETAFLRQEASARTNAAAIAQIWHRGEQQAIHHYSRAIEIRRILARRCGLNADGPKLVEAYVNYATLLRSRKRPGEAADLCTRAISLARRLKKHGKNVSHIHDLAWAYLTRSGPVTDLGQIDEAENDILRAIRLYESVPPPEANTFAEPLARAYLAESRMCLRKKDSPGASAFLQKCVDSVKTLAANNRDNVDLKHLLAKAYAGQAMYAWRNDQPLGLGNADASVALYEELVAADGRREFRYELTMSYRTKALLLENDDKYEDALKQWDRCIAIRRSLVYGEDCIELAEKLAEDFACRAACRASLQLDKGVRDDMCEYDHAVTTYKAGGSTISAALLRFASEVRKQMDDSVKRR